MRPHGEIRIALMAGLKAGPARSATLAHRTGVGLAATRRTLDNMVRRGDALVVSMQRVTGCKRPVPVYGLAPHCAATQAAPAANWDLMARWARAPALA